MLNLTHDSTPPDVIRCRSGKRARLIEAPVYNAINDAWFVLYEHADNRFSLFWPEMRGYRTGPDCPIDAVEIELAVKATP